MVHNWMAPKQLENWRKPPFKNTISGGGFHPKSCRTLHAQFPTAADCAAHCYCVNATQTALKCTLFTTTAESITVEDGNWPEASGGKQNNYFCNAMDWSTPRPSHFQWRVQSNSNHSILTTHFRTTGDRLLYVLPVDKSGAQTNLSRGCGQNIAAPVGTLISFSLPTYNGRCSLFYWWKQRRLTKDTAECRSVGIWDRNGRQFILHKCEGVH